jgi:arylsulfatase A-like enzyme
VRPREAVLLLALAASGCGRTPAPPALALVTLDTFRQDHLGCAGHPGVRTPHLDRLARRGTLWRDAVTPIPLTTPSHASILTGVAPRTHGVLRNRMRLGSGVPTLAAQLREAGFRTGAIVSSRVVLDPELGLGRGFETYDVIDPPELPASGEGATTAARAVAWLAEHGGGASFLWVHFFDAHLPYLPPAPWARLYGAVGPPAVASGAPPPGLDDAASDDLRARYAGEVSFLDACVGRVARALAARDPHARSALLVTADHGEGLGEHGRTFGHDVLLYDTSLRVPLILATSGPDPEPGAGRISAEPARTLDVAPTLAGLAGLAPDPAVEGRDLLREPEPEGDARTLVAETHPDPAKSPPLFALRADDAKVVWKPRERRREYYDLVRDPGEQHDLGDSAAPSYRVLAEDLEIDLRDRPARAARTLDEDRGSISEGVRRALESLGYVTTPP